MVRHDALNGARQVQGCTPRLRRAGATMPAAPSRALCLVRLRGGQLEVEPAAAAWLAGLRQPVAVVSSTGALHLLWLDSLWLYSPWLASRICAVEVKLLRLLYCPGHSPLWCVCGPGLVLTMATLTMATITMATRSMVKLTRLSIFTYSAAGHSRIGRSFLLNQLVGAADGF